MRYFEKSFGDKGGYAKFYLQEAHAEIDKNRLFPTLVVCPGGAYLWTSHREDEAVALKFLSEGFHVVVVHYPTEGLEAMSAPENLLPKNPVSAFPNPLVCLAQTVSYMKENAEAFHLDLDHLVVGGFSAGGNLAGLLATNWQEDWLEALVGKAKESYKPSHILLAYAAYSIQSDSKIGNNNRVAFAATGAMHSTSDQLEQLNLVDQVTDQVPPCFIWHTLEDRLVSAQGALDFAAALSKKEVPFELHLFQEGKHGLVLGDLKTGVKASNQNAQVAKWVDLFLEWLAPYKSQQAGFYLPKEG